MERPPDPCPFPTPFGREETDRRLEPELPGPHPVPRVRYGRAVHTAPGRKSGVLSTPCASRGHGRQLEWCIAHPCRHRVRRAIGRQRKIPRRTCFQLGLIAPSPTTGGDLEGGRDPRRASPSRDRNIGRACSVTMRVDIDPASACSTWPTTEREELARQRRGTPRTAFWIDARPETDGMVGCKLIEKERQTRPRITVSRFVEFVGQCRPREMPRSPPSFCACASGGPWACARSS